jgi:hypothetical protein
MLDITFYSEDKEEADIRGEFVISCPVDYP